MENGQYLTPNPHPLVPTFQSISTETLINPVVSAPLRKRTARANRDEDRINSKVEILRVLEEFCKERQLKKITCHHVFAESYNSGKVAVSPETRKQIPSVSFATLQRWYKALQDGSVQALGGRYGNRPGQTKIDTNPQIKDFVLGIMVNFPHATGGHIFMAALQTRFENEILPSKRTVERWVQDWKCEKEELFTATSNPDSWKNRFMTAFGSYSEAVDRLNQLWEMDSTPVDVILEDGRYHLIGSIDVYSRRLKLLVVPKSKAFAIGTLLRQCLLDWGVPEVVKTDNGRDYTANYLQRFFVDLGIRLGQKHINIVHNY